MTKRVFMVHRWGGQPDDIWFPWLQKELKQKGFQIFAPLMPDTDHPIIENWVPALAQAVGTPDEQTYFVGHSMGCETIARYLETLPEGQKVGGVVFVAGYFKRLTLESKEEYLIADPWLKTPLDLQNVASHLSKSVAIFSDDDPYVPLDNQDDFRDVLKSEVIVMRAMGHFSKSSGITELPIALEKVLELAG